MVSEDITFEEVDSVAVDETAEYTKTVLAEKVYDYRKLAASRKSIEQSMKDAKEEILPLVESLVGGWKDDNGFARMINREKSVKGDNKAIHRQAEIWAASDDAHLKTVGETLLQHFTDKPAYSYLQIK